MKKTFLLWGILMVYLLFSCGGTETMSCIVHRKAESALIEKAIDNTTPAEELITKRYSIDSRGIEFFELIKTPENNWKFVGLDMASVNEQYEIECLREIETGYYAVFLDDVGGRVFLKFENIDDVYRVTDVFHAARPIFASDFEQIEIGQWTLEDVRKFAPYGEEMFSEYTGNVPSSLHLTYDGYEVLVSYRKEASSQMTVASVRVYNTGGNRIVNVLLPVDIPKRSGTPGED